MQHFYSRSPSGLQQQQPQRYSDRHQQQISGSGEYQPRSPCAAQQGTQDKNRQVGVVSHQSTSTGGDDPGIKSYLKKTDVRASTRTAKPDENMQVEELEEAEKEGVSHTSASGT